MSNTPAKPLLIVITGRPASGKSTLAHLLARELNCPLLSRDEFKEGYINTLGVPHSQLDDSAATHIYTAFFDAIELLITRNISLIAEAAFQDKLWKQRLTNLEDKATIKVIVCHVPAETAKKRFTQRLLTDPEREKFHGDSPLNLSGPLFNDTYEPLHMNTPTLEVDTTRDYRPDLNKIAAFLLKTSEI